MKKLSFLWEIGVEEIPASWLPSLIDDLRDLFEKGLEAAGVEAEPVESCGTLRRLVVHVPKLLEKGPDRVDEVTGPPLSVARDDEGAWTKAALGFAKKNAIDPGKLSLLHTAKGDYVGFEKKVKGRKTLELLPDVMAQTLRSLSFPKFMNWDATLPDGKGPFPFGRPIRWMVALFGSRVVPFQIEVVGSPPVVSGRKSRGHRFLAPKGKKPGAPFTVRSFRELKRELKRHYVLVDPEERHERLEKELVKLEKKARARRAPGLSTRVVAELLEWPGAVLGTYPQEFLSLPDEVRHTVLIHHQHYFPLRKKPAFLAPTNMASDRKGFMRQGAERVVVARLRDAKFFWDEDLKKPLAEREAELEGVRFHEKLGSYRLKADRMEPLAVWIANECGARESRVRRAVRLAKCDLVTGMVGEFPELQGIVGGLYAREQGEDEAVWKAVYSHYRPAGMGRDEAFPANREGAVVSLADKIDSLAGMFAVGVVPKGSRDPFGLRRAALGALRVLRESEERLGFALEIAPEALLREALGIVSEQLAGRVDPGAERALMEFLTERLRFVFSRDYRYDEINAVFALGPLTRPVADVEKRLKAVSSLRGSEDFEALSAAFKRVGNILSGKTPGPVDPNAFVEEEERGLFAALTAIEPEARANIEEGLYEGALKQLSTLRSEVDRFFDRVLVMAKEPELRDNRLALLHRMQGLFLEAADLSEIVPGESSGRQRERKNKKAS